MATAPIYCTHKELKRVFPQIDEYDTKTPVYGWAKELDDFSSSQDLWYCTNTGLITQLFINGEEVYNIPFPSTQKTQLDGYHNQASTAYTVDSTTGIEAGDIIKVDSHYSKVSVIASETVVAIQGGSGSSVELFNTLSVDHSDDTSVYQVVDASEYKSAASYWFTYDADMDMCIVAVPADTDPRDLLMESGEDFTTLVTQFRTDASRYLDSKLDPNLPANQFKDKSGNFDYMIIRTTALLCAVLMIRATDPTSEMASAFMAEAQENIDALNNGKAGLSWQNTSDSSKGVIRDVGTVAGTVRPVDTRGHYSGTYDLIKIKIDTTGGAIGTATYSVWTKDGDKLGMNEGNQVVTTEVINGDYQALAGGLQVRFAGTDFDSTATADDTWEVEVQGYTEEVDSSSMKSIRQTRR